MEPRSRPPRQTEFLAENLKSHMSLGSFYNAVGRRIYGRLWPIDAPDLLEVPPTKWFPPDNRVTFARRVRDDLIIAASSGRIKFNFFVPLRK
jgi:hypothetical protein